MANKFEIIEENALVITDGSGTVILDAPKSDIYYDSKKLSTGEIVIYDTSATNKGSSKVSVSKLTDAIDKDDTPFTETSFRLFARQNLGFKTASGGSDAVVDGVERYDTVALLPATGDETKSYKVTADPTASNNGFYSWNGSAYTQDASLYNGDVSDGDTEGVSGNTVYKALTTQKNYNPPLKVVTNQNAITSLYSEAEENDNLVSSGDNLTNVYNDDVFSDYAIPNVIRASSTSPVDADYPRGAFYVSVDDLADIGIVPDDTTPPLVNLRAGFLKSTLNNATVPTIYFCLRYGGSVSSDWDATNDVMTFNNLTSYYWDASGDEDYWNGVGESWTHEIETSDTAEHKIFAHKNVPIRATYGGEDLTGIFIIYKAGGSGSDVSYDMFMPAVVPNNVTWNILDPYYNVNEIQPTVKIKEADLATPLSNKINTAYATSVNTITVANSSRILIIGDSFTSGGARDFRDKGWVSKFSALSDYVCEGFGESGDNYLTGGNAILTNEKRYHPTVGVNDINNTYAVLMFSENDSQYYVTYEAEYWRKNIVRLCDAVKSLGAKPILATEFGNGAAKFHYMILKDVAEEYGYQFIDISSDGYTFNTDRYLPFWNNGHPGVRTNSIIWYNMHKALKGLQDIEQGIKIYRNRVGYTYSTNADLLYRNVYDREEKWREISIGHRRSTDATINYYDDLDDGVIASEAETSEYLKIVNNENVSFSDKALLRVTIPATAKNITSAKLILSDKTLTCYIRKYIDATLTIDTGSYLTDILEPNGLWEAVTANADGDFEFTDLTNYMAYDTIEILLDGASSFNLSDVKLEWSGTANKVKTVKELTYPTVTTELLSVNNFDGTDIGSWTNPDSKVPFVPFDSNMPRNITKIIELAEDETISQNFATTTTEPKTAVIEIWARRLPAKFDQADTFSLNDDTGNNEIWEDSYDNAKLSIIVNKSSEVYNFDEIVPLHWVKIRKKIYLTSPKNNTVELELKALSKDVQIAYASIKI